MMTLLDGPDSGALIRSRWMSGVCSSSVIFSTKKVAPQVVQSMSRATSRSSRMFDDRQPGQLISSIVPI